VILTDDQAIAKLNSSVFPGQQGRPLEHVIAAKGRRVQARGVRTVPTAAEAHPGRRADHRRAAHAAGRRVGRGEGAHRGHGRASGAGRSAGFRPGRQAGRGPAALCRHHRQPQTRSSSTLARRWSPPGCASAPRRWPREASPSRTSRRPTTSSRGPCSRRSTPAAAVAGRRSYREAPALSVSDSGPRHEHMALTGLRGWRLRWWSVFPICSP